MGLPPPPGLNASTNPSASSHPSLPARPPSSAPPSGSFKPAFPSSNAARTGGYASSGLQGFQPRQLSTPTTHTPPNNFSQYQPPSYNQSSYAPPQQQSYGAPQIQNPFAPPGQAGRGFDAPVDPEMEAQIAQWQSAYAGKDSSSSYAPRRYDGAGGASFAGTSANAAPLGGRNETLSSQAMSSAVHADTGVATVVSGADGKQATVVRSGGGTQWTDSSLLEWDPSHFRIFVGNLAGETTDESLLKAFSRWPSVQKARVVRDKRTTKSKGFGFVSFSDGDEFFQAAREMQGKYIGSHPVIIKRSTTEIKAVVPKDNRRGKNNKGKNNKHGGGGGGGHAKTEAGVQKAGSKTKGGLKILG